MNRRRVARRVALPRPARITAMQAETLPSLATKVWRYALPSLSAGGRAGRLSLVGLVGVERRSVMPPGHGLSSAGVRLLASEGTCRRVVWLSLPAATLLITPSLVTKRKKNMNVGMT